MTFKERWIQEHPGEEFGSPYDKCPHLLGYEVNETEDGCNHMDYTCDYCWHRPTPETVTFFEDAKKLAASALKTGDAIGNAAKAMTKHAPTIVGVDLNSIENPGVYVAEEPASNAPIPTIKDSGDRTQFETGAVRDMREGKGRCDLMPLHVVSKHLEDAILYDIAQFQKHNDVDCLYRCLGIFSAQWDDGKTKHSRDEITNQRLASMYLEVAKHFEEGAKKYGENNWQKGIPVHCYIDSAVRHYLKWLRGDKDEPHDRAFVWNLLCCIWEVDYHKENDHVQN